MPKHSQETRERLTGVVTHVKRGVFLLFFDGGLKENSYMCHEVAVIAQRSGKKLCVTDFSLVYNVDQSAPWYRRRGFGCAGNVETLLVLTVDFSLGQMQKTNRSVGESTWYSNALCDLRRRHPSKAPQMSVDDKKKLYQEGLGRTADCRPRLEPSVGPNLRLGSLRGCNPRVWHP